MKSPAVSVVIPSYQSSSCIEACLRALDVQITSISFEVILVDSSDDGADLLARSLFPEVHVIHFNERRSTGAARNAGIAAARGEVILFLDADCIPCPTWIGQMEDGIRKRGADGVGGSIVNGTPWSVSGSVGFYLEFFRFLRHSGKPAPAQFLLGGNSGFRRSVLCEEKYADWSAGEDVLLSWSLAQKGRNLVFLPLAAVTHANKTGFRRIIQYQFQIGHAACAYRTIVSPRMVRRLKSMPVLLWLMPPIVVSWIGWSLLRRRLVADFLRFVFLLPLSLVGNGAWAYGLHGALQDKTPAG